MTPNENLIPGLERAIEKIEPYMPDTYVTGYHPAVAIMRALRAEIESEKSKQAESKTVYAPEAETIYGSLANKGPI